MNWKMPFFVEIMISRKERKIQRALGTEDGMPPTIRYRVKWWWWNHVTSHTYKWTMSAVYQWCAFKLPKNLVYHCVIRVWAHATTCPSGNGEDVTITTVSDALKRWEKE